MTGAKASPWIRLLPLFGAAAIIVLVITASLLWFAGSGSEQAEVVGEALGSGFSGKLTLALIAFALVLVVLMMVAYYAARDYRRAAELQAAQSQRNQEAILRLLDELSSLADGDLTVQATVTEDITGAIADSINYAIEALRELVQTVNDSSILVDAAAKQTAVTSKQLVKSAEMQSKQAAAASDSSSGFQHRGRCTTAS